MSDPRIGYWLHDDEDQEFLNSLPDESPVLAMRGTYDEVRVDARKVMKIEHQGAVGSCQGHALSSCVELCYYIATGDLTRQLSRAYGYYETQRIDGITSDRGSTISGGIKLATTRGIPQEKLWTYSGRYDNRRPANWTEVETDAQQHRIGQSYRMTTYDGVRTFLGSGQGGISIGISWSGEVDRAIVERFSGSGGGGHAIALLGLSARLDNSGRPYVLMMNSWGANWGNGGWAEWSPSAVEQMLRHRYTACFGLSDMPNLKPRSYTLDNLKKDLRI
jgi:C1A family cysteine protease